MTNEDLDKICCEFAGIEPVTGHKYVAVDGHPEIGWCAYCYRPKYAHLFPPVSTSWEAAGQLMDALAEKGIMAAPSPVRYLVGDRGVKWVARAFDSASQRGTDEMESDDSGPMALALAVAALAKEPK